MNLQEWLIALTARTDALEKRADDEDEAERRQYLFELIGAMFEKANGYLGLLQAAGYVGFFAVWEGARSYMSRPQNLAVTFLIGGSLVLFIAWHAFLNMVLARQQSGFASVALTPPEKFKAAREALQRDGEKLRARLALLLLPVNVVILASALAGMGVILWAVGKHLVEIA